MNQICNVVVLVVLAVGGGGCSCGSTVVADFWDESGVFGVRSGGGRRQCWIVGVKSGFLTWCFYTTSIENMHNKLKNVRIN